jgi:hypothetical protein
MSCLTQRCSGFALLVLILTGCAQPPMAPERPDHPFASGQQEASPEAIQLTEPGADEVVIVINHNAAFGNHAGIFAGPRLSDPAGSYAYFRRSEPGWQPGLQDYVRFQSSDGMHIRAYRFRLPGADFSAVVARLPEADQAKPLFCAAAVQNSIAGIGPFALIPQAGWTTPAKLAERLDQLITSPGTAGACELPNGRPCFAEATTVLQTRLDPATAHSSQ